MDNSRGLPRSFVDDPFFQQHHHQRNSPSADFFRDLAPPPPSQMSGGGGGGSTRRFGSNPRLFNDGGGSHFFDDFDRSNGGGTDFGTLPRRDSHSRSPRPPSAAERAVPIQRAGGGNVGVPPPSPNPAKPNASPQPQRKSEHEQRKPPPVTILHAQPAVEINNTTPSGYTNGRLNPDRAAADAAVAAEINAADGEVESSVPRLRQNSLGGGGGVAPSATDTQSQISGTSGDRTSKVQVPDILTSAPNVGTASATKVTPRRSGGLERKTSVDGRCEQLIDLLDETEARVEQLRESAARLEIEKEQILDIINNLKLNSEILCIGEGERDDINAATDRILKRCRAVDVIVNTPRSEEQSRALEEVNSLIQNVLQKMQEDLNSSKDSVQRFLNACSPDEPPGPIDARFQSKVVECTADDQKKIRRRLAQIITQIDRAERTCIPNF